ncbi:unnamed protein product, partial [Adineta ricciae]
QRLVSLDEALKSIEPQIDDLSRYIKMAKRYCKYPSEHGLTREESASLYIYTMEWDETSLYRVLNRALRDANREIVKVWFPYLKLLDSALEKLPTTKEVVWRGVSLDIGKNFVKNQVLTWWTVNSCSSSVNVIKKFFGNETNYTLFMIQALNGKNVSGYTAYEDENEIILPIGSHFRVKGDSLEQSNQSYLVHLIEIDDNDNQDALNTMNIYTTMNKLSITNVPKAHIDPRSNIIWVDSNPDISKCTGPFELRNWRVARFNETADALNALEGGQLKANNIDCVITSMMERGGRRERGLVNGLEMLQRMKTTFDKAGITSKPLFAVISCTADMETCKKYGVDIVVIGNYTILQKQIITEITKRQNDYFWMLYTEDSTHSECFMSGDRRYCRPMVVNDIREACRNGHLLTFAELKRSNVTSENLIKWLIPLQRIQWYTAYLNYDENIPAAEASVCKCSENRIGTNCEYSLNVGAKTINDVLVRQMVGSHKNSHETLTTLVDGITCIGANIFLEWRHICDGFIQCRNGADEIDCHLLEFHKCESDEFQCRN